MATKTKATAKKATKSAAKAATGATASKGAAKGGNEMYRTSKVYKSAKTVPIDQLPPQFSRADVEFIGVDHSGASYEARVFINNSSADENTPKTEASGYAGSFNIFGHTQCFGDVGHCEVNGERDEFDPRPSHQLEPIRKVVIATDAIKRAVGQSPEISVTVVPIVKSWGDQTDLTDVLKFDHINLVTYD